MDTESESTGATTGDVVREIEEGVHVGTTVVTAVSEAAGLPPDEMGVELNDVVDPDALNRIFSHRVDDSPRMGGRVVFSMLGHVVTVSGDRTVTVSGDTAAVDD